MTETMNPTVNFKVERLYGSRGADADEGKVRILILYSKKTYKQGPVPGELVAEQSNQRHDMFLVERNPDLLESSLGAAYDSLINDPFFKQGFIEKMKSSVLELPDSATTVDGVWVVPELMATLDIQTPVAPAPTRVTVEFMREARRRALTRVYPPHVIVKRRIVPQPLVTIPVPGRGPLTLVEAAYMRSSARLQQNMSGGVMLPRNVRRRRMIRPRLTNSDEKNEEKTSQLPV